MSHLGIKNTKWEQNVARKQNVTRKNYNFTLDNAIEISVTPLKYFTIIKVSHLESISQL